MDFNSVFQFYALCLTVFFTLGIYLFEKKHPLFGFFCIMVGFFILAGLSIMFESIALEILCLTINIAIICHLLWEKWATKFIGLFLLFVEITKIKRYIHAKAKDKE